MEKEYGIGRPRTIDSGPYRGIRAAPGPVEMLWILSRGRGGGTASNRSEGERRARVNSFVFLDLDCHERIGSPVSPAGFGHPQDLHIASAHGPLLRLNVRSRR